MLVSILYSAAAIFTYMNLVFLAALVMKDNSILDVAWGIGFILVAALTFFLEPGATSLHILVAVLILLWGIRLASHIAVRNRGRREDWRYARWRRDWGKWFVPRVYAQVFLLQGLLLLIISYPIILVNSSQQSELGPLVILGTLLWLVGFVFEAVGDCQLLRFKRNPENRGKLMTRGLWNYTRHPNYFGECVMWWGIFFIALSIPRGWTAVISPLLITLLLLRVSGVTMLEKKYKDNQEFSEYSRRTSAFVPWFPKK